MRDSVVKAPMFDFTFGVQMPGGEFAKRYNTSYTLGGAFLFKSKTNWIRGFDAHFLWSDNVNETNLLSDMRTEQGEIVNQNGEYAFVRIGLRGWYAGGQFGRIFPGLGPNPNSGLFVTAGAGFIQYKLRYNVEDKLAPQLRDDYVKLYDQLTNGLALSQSIGYRHLSNSRLVNFFVAFDVRQGFTRNRRSYNVDLGGGRPGAQFDFWYGLRVGWTFPMYQRASEGYYYY